MRAAPGCMEGTASVRCARAAATSRRHRALRVTRCNRLAQLRDTRQVLAHAPHHSGLPSGPARFPWGAASLRAPTRRPPPRRARSDPRRAGGGGREGGDSAAQVLELRVQPKQRFAGDTWPKSFHSPSSDTVMRPSIASIWPRYSCRARAGIPWLYRGAVRLLVFGECRPNSIAGAMPFKPASMRGRIARLHRLLNRDGALGGIDRGALVDCVLERLDGA